MANVADAIRQAFMGFNPAYALNNYVTNESTGGRPPVAIWSAETDDIVPVPVEYDTYTYSDSEWRGAFTSGNTDIQYGSSRKKDENCRYCGQLHKRESLYGGCPNCGAPHNA